MTGHLDAEQKRQPDLLTRLPVIHGGYGFIREYRVERLYRDAKLQTIGGGTNQIMCNVIIAEMGLRVK